MNALEPGQRVSLAHLHTPTSELCLGQQGVVRSVDHDGQSVTVGWDTGTVTTVRLHAGDRLDILAAPTPISERGWQQALATVAENAARDGQLALQRWIRSLTHHHGAAVRMTARHVLTNVSYDDPDDTTLPWHMTSRDAQPPTHDQLSELLAGGQPLAWKPVNSIRWEQAFHVYRDGFDDAVRDQSIDWCRRTLIPAGHGRDLAELAPDTLRIGRVAVFSGDWLFADPDQEPDYLRIGYVGTLLTRWNGWAVFSCTRQVAEAIVDEQQQHRSQQQAALESAGLSEPDARREVDQMLAALWFTGDTLTVDQRAMHDDPAAILHLDPDSDGCYTTDGWGWTWEAVDPYRCDQVIGYLPAEGAEQQFVALVHTPQMCVPHDRLSVHVVRHWPVRTGLAYVGALLLDGHRIGLVGDDAAGGGTDLVLTGPAAADLVGAFVAASRYRGEPVTWQRLIEALVDEAYLTAAVNQANTGGATLLRVVDDTGHTVALQPTDVRPRGTRELQQLARTLTHRPDRQWQLWTGQSWQPVPTTAHH